MKDRDILATDAQRPDMGSLGTLEAVIRWLADTRAGQVVDVVYQDEYTADVVVVLSGQTEERYLVFDTT